MLNIIKEILQKENITYNTLTKSESGFSNLVYFVDDRYVIKVLEPNGNEIKFTHEIGFYKTHHFDFIPKIIKSGTYKNTTYIIMEKLQGVSLYDIWHTLSLEERKAITIELANILKKINTSKEFHFLHKRYIRTTPITQFQYAFKRNIEILNQKGYNTEFLTEYAETRIPIIFKEEKFGLVYNDAHFDNFIYDGKTVKLIDFDRILYTNVDYELLILTTMIDNPKKFANERQEQNISSKK